MGHYDDLYEAEEEQHRKEKRKKEINAMVKMQELLDDMGGVVFDNFGSEAEIRRALRTMRREFVLWQYDRGLLVQDPKILIEVLKDDK